MKKAYDVAAGTLTFTAADGTVQTLNVAELPEAIRVQAMYHGLSQKIGDSYAGAGSEADPEAYAKQAVADTIKQLFEGAWRAAGGGGGPKYGQLVQALAQVSGKSLEEAAAIVEGLSDDEKKEMQKKPKIVAVIAQMRAAAAVARAEKAAKAAEAEG